MMHIGANGPGDDDGYEWELRDYLALLSIILTAIIVYLLWK